MWRTRLDFVDQMGIIGSPVKYKWNDEISCGFDRPQNTKLIDAIDLTSYRAKMAISALLTEMMVWRFEGLTDLTDIENRAAAAWAAAIDAAYVKSLDMTLSDDDDFQNKYPIEGAIETSLDALETVFNRYQSGNIYLSEAVASLSLIVRHVIPNKKEFSTWFSDTLKNTITVFERGMDEDDFYNLEEYNCSHERPVFREFFDHNFIYTDDSAREAINRFLKNLDHNQNPYLRSPDEMLADGFQGTPYTY